MCAGVPLSAVRGVLAEGMHAVLPCGAGLHTDFVFLISDVSNKYRKS